VFWPKRPTFGSDEPTQHGVWRRVAERISRRPRAVWGATTAVLLLACLGALQLDTSGIPTQDQYTTDMESVDGQLMLADHGLADASNTVQVVADADQAGPVRQALTGIQGLGEPTQPVVKDGTAFLQAPLAGDVADPATFATVQRARDAVHAVPGAHGLVGGWSAIYLDTKIASSHDNKLIIPAILLVVLLILVALLRALAAPLILLATVVLSFGAALGLSTLLFVHVLGFESSDPGFPLFAFIFLVALGIDYNIFLMTRVREETIVRGTRVGSVVALGSTGGVITSAGLVLAATFAVLGTIPLVFLAELGLTVALGILLDTMIVRSVLVTAINLDLGQRIWWPSRLASRDETVLGSPTAHEEEMPAPVG
jgi:RND superfamily putative drug exporter